MNERIEELAKQCVSISFYVDTASENFDYQKFAELIIRECASLCECEWNGDADSFDTSEAYNECANMIKQHFGVKK